MNEMYLQALFDHLPGWIHDNLKKYFSIILPFAFQMRLRPGTENTFSSENWSAQPMGHSFRGA